MASASTLLTLDSQPLQVGGQRLLVDPVFGALAGVPSVSFYADGPLDSSFVVHFVSGSPSLAADLNVTSFSGTRSILWDKPAGEWQLPAWWKDSLEPLVVENPSGRRFGRLLSDADFVSSTDMLLHLPEVFRSDPYLRDIFNAMGSEFDRFRAALDMVLCALFVEDAPEWGLRLWAEEIGFDQADLTLEGWRQALLSELTEVAVTQADVLRIIRDFGALDSVLELAFPADYEAQLTIGGVLVSELQRREFISAELRRRFPAHILVRPVLWLADIPSVPLSVALLNVDGPPGGLDVSWEEPTQTGGFALTYLTRYRLSSESVWTDGPSSDSLFVEVSPLVPGSSYDVQVQASNDVGDGPWSDSVSASIDFSEPSAVRDLRLQRLPGGSVRVVWQAPQYDGGIKLSPYEIRYRPAGGEWVATLTTSDLRIDIPGGDLGYGVWEVAVRATNTDDDAGRGTVFGAWVSDEVVAWTAPSAVTNMVVAAQSLTSVRVSWSDPVDSGASGLAGSRLDYLIRYRLKGAALWTESRLDGFTSLATSWTISHLQRGRTYEFEVAAENDAGAGPWTGREQMMGTGLPSAPEVSSLVLGPTTASLVWSLADDGGSDVVSYSVRYRIGTGAWTEVAASTVLTHTVSGLSKNTAYEFAVKATNETGDSPWSGPSRGTTTSTVPAAPTGLTFTTTRTTLGASWTAPADTGGVPIEAYGYAIRIDGRFVNGLADSLSSHLFEDLAAGTYYEVRISARNSVGFGAAVVGAVTLPTAVPETPEAPTLSLSDVSMSITWSAPFDSGLEISGYSLRYRTGSGAWTVADVGLSLAYAVAGLSKNTEYEVQVRATNEDGNSDWSDSASGTTRFTLPAEPESVAVSSSGSDFFVLGWSEPSDTGGIPISRYEVRYRLVGGEFWTSVEVGTVLTWRVDNRLAGRSYQFGVRARNTSGWGPWSAPGSVSLPSV